MVISLNLPVERVDVIEFTLWQPNVAMENPPSDCFYGKIPQMVDAFFKIYHNML